MTPSPLGSASALFCAVPLAELGKEDVSGIEGVLTLYHGELLEGVYDEWALRERERFRSLYLNCLTAPFMEFHASRRISVLREFMG